MKKLLLGYLLMSSVLFISCKNEQKPEQNLSIKNIMDDVITRLYEQVSPDQYNTINDAFMLQFLSEKEKKVLATKYQYFKVNVPVIVSLMRDVKQATVPFWMEESGFKNTGKIVKNEVFEYEVWQKEFNTGWVNLGIPGFDMDRTIYFITVGAKNKDDELKITEPYPSKYSLEVMRKGAFTYHDWDGLKITEFPEELEGQVFIHYSKRKSPRSSCGRSF